MRKATKTVTQRGQSKPPKDLARFIELVNGELGRELPDLFGTFEAAIQDNPSVSLRDLWPKISGEAVAKLSPETRAFLGPAANFPVFSARYGQLESAREALLAIVRRRAHSGKLTIFDPELPGLEYSVSLSVNLVVSDKGVLTPSESPVLDALSGVRVDHIRACAICGRIFWAPRINSECCSERCRKTYNQRKSREDRAYKKAHPKAGGPRRTECGRLGGRPKGSGNKQAKKGAR